MDDRMEPFDCATCGALIETVEDARCHPHLYCELVKLGHRNPAAYLVSYGFVRSVGIPMDETAPADYNDGTDDDWDDPIEVINDLRDSIARIRADVDALAEKCSTVGIREAVGCLTGALVLLDVAQGRLT